MKAKNSSLIVLIFSLLIIWLFVFKFFPKHNQHGQSSTICWDVSGYYFYLPAIFIYHDLKHLDFKDTIIKKYNPTPHLDQAFKVENGNYVCKYSCGMAIQYLPSFLIGHFITKYFTKYPTDGFSKPYHFSIALGSFLISFLGLYFLRKILLKYYSDKITAISLFTLILVTNYFNYSAFDGAMSHNYLFSLYTLIIFLSIKFYEYPTIKKSVLIGLLIGLCALTRPTEIITFLIPILWGVNILSKQSRIDRWNFIKLHKIKFIYAVIACVAIGSIQLIYWKYVSGHWLVYSYQDQGFSWFKPHILDGLFSIRGGWLIYTPVMIFSLIGIYQIKKTSSVKSHISLLIIFMLLYIYISFSWDIWWYGGSLGQRT
ncbi:MAG TPA: hypothetical protein VK590_05425, partial [Saprospiraceae bacterium]|nr:hypothetical protein [Saprospiraceae bacterium]